MTAAPTFKVRIFGPNLRGNTETFHVHAEGCRDCRNYGRKGKYGGDDDGWVIDIETARDVVFDVYDPDEFCYDPDTEYGLYRGDFKFFPCCAGIPEGEL